MGTKEGCQSLRSEGWQSVYIGRKVSWQGWTNWFLCVQD